MENKKKIRLEKIQDASTGYYFYYGDAELAPQHGAESTKKKKIIWLTLG